MDYDLDSETRMRLYQERAVRKARGGLLKVGAVVTVIVAAVLVIQFVG